MECCTSKENLQKIELGLGKKRKVSDKREYIKNKTLDREIKKDIF